jgi:hypothetical protein
MIEPSLWGLSKSEWELINSFANWLSAIGTLAAVVVSLYLASRYARPQAKLTVGHRIAIEPGVKDFYPEYIQFHVVNTGERPITITQIGWKVGLRKKRYAVQMFETLASSPLPVELSHGQEAKWMVPLNAREEHWLVRFARDMLLPNFRIGCFTLRAQAFTSLGHVFETKPESGLLSKLKEAAKGVR